MTNDDDMWDRAADVVVVGTGAAGFTAALTAAAEGSEVLLIEKADAVGGTTAKSGGAYFWLPNNPLLKEKGLVDDRAAALKLMARLSFPHLYNPISPTLGLSKLDHELLEVFFDNTGAALEAMTKAGAWEPELDMDMPDYCADIEENQLPYGRHVIPGGWVSANDFLSGNFDQSQGTTRGEFLVARMAAAAEAKGIRILLGHRAAALIQNEAGEVAGLVVHVGPRAILVQARQAVVFASGGFTHNVEMRRQYLRGPAFGGCATEAATGDFVAIAGEAGAQFGNMTNAWWDQVLLESMIVQPSSVRDVFMPFGDSMVIVNKYGARVVNEKMVYNERAQVHFQWNPTKREYSNLLLFQIYDDAVASNPTDYPFRVPVPLPGQEAKYVVSGDTLEDLATRLDERLESLSDHTGGFRLDRRFVGNLKATIEKFNLAAVTGVDEDFGRGSTPIQLAWVGQPREESMLNPTMFPLASEGPYHAIILAAGMLDTKGGPRINGNAQVLAQSGEVIPGLYGAGNCIASPAGQAYWSAGGTLGLALTFGYLAGKAAAKEPVKCM